MLDPIKNLVYVNALIGYSASATIISIQSGEGAKLPDPATLGAFNLIWYNHTDYKNPADDPNVEIIRVTGKSVDTLNITRGQEGTSATNKNTSGKSYRLLLGFTKKMIDDINSAINLKLDIAGLLYAAGIFTSPSITDNGNGSVTIGSGTYNLYSNSSGSGIISQYTITGGTFNLTDLAQNYIVANYSSGTPILELISNVTLINETTIIPVFSIFRNGTILHIQPWDNLGLALTNKIHQSIVKTQRYRRESGLALSETGTRNLLLTSGVVWIGAVSMTLEQIATATDNMLFWKHVAGVWTQSTISQYNNTQYDNGTDLVTLGVGKYAVNWIYRGVENQKHLYLILGTGEYTLAQAESAVAPIPPTAISSHAVLVGKIIVLKNAATATSIQSAFDVQFSYAIPQEHNDLTGLNSGDYKHLTAAEYASGVFKDTVQTLTNKRITKRVVVATQSATPTINSDNGDIFQITGLAQAITSMTTNLSGTPVAGDMMMIQITDNGTARAITWGASFASTTEVALPTTTVASTMIRILFQRNNANTIWDCIAVN